MEAGMALLGSLRDAMSDETARKSLSTLLVAGLGREMALLQGVCEGEEGADGILQSCRGYCEGRHEVREGLPPRRAVVALLDRTATRLEVAARGAEDGPVLSLDMAVEDSAGSAAAPAFVPSAGVLRQRAALFKTGPRDGQEGVAGLDSRPPFPAALVAARAGLVQATQASCPLGAASLIPPLLPLAGLATATGGPVEDARAAPPDIAVASLRVLAAVVGASPVGDGGSLLHSAAAVILRSSARALPLLILAALEGGQAGHVCTACVHAERSALLIAVCVEALRSPDAQGEPCETVKGALALVLRHLARAVLLSALVSKGRLLTASDLMSRTYGPPPSLTPKPKPAAQAGGVRAKQGRPAARPVQPDPSEAPGLRATGAVAVRLLAPAAELAGALVAARGGEMSAGQQQADVALLAGMSSLVEYAAVALSGHAAEAGEESEMLPTARGLLGALTALCVQVGSLGPRGACWALGYNNPDLRGAGGGRESSRSASKVGRRPAGGLDATDADMTIGIDAPLQPAAQEERAPMSDADLGCTLPRLLLAAAIVANVLGGRLVRDAGGAAEDEEMWEGGGGPRASEIESALAACLLRICDLMTGLRLDGVVLFATARMAPHLLLHAAIHSVQGAPPPPPVSLLPPLPSPPTDLLLAYSSPRFKKEEAVREEAAMLLRCLSEASARLVAATAGKEGGRAGVAAATLARVEQLWTEGEE
jgi:hypothetical protein